MRIAIIQDYLRGGGTEKHTVLLANEFHEQGDPVMVIRFRPGGILEPKLKAPSLNLQPWDTRLNCFAPGLCKQLVQWAPQIALCMGHEANRRVATMKRQLPETSIVATLRSGKPLTRRLFASAQAADAIVSNSVWARTRAVKMGIRKSKIQTINNLLGFTLNDLSAVPSRPTVRQELDTPNEAPVLINVAGFRQKKGQADLLRMLAPLCKDTALILWLVGDGPERPHCEALAKGLGIAQAVRFLGHRKTVFALLQAADLYGHASQTESQPNALIEAQACGLPVVALDVAGVAETFQHGISGTLVHESDSTSYLEAVRQLIHCSELRHQYGRAGYHNTWTHFNDSQTQLRYRELFQTLIDTQRR